MGKRPVSPRVMNILSPWFARIEASEREISRCKETIRDVLAAHDEDFARGLLNFEDGNFVGVEEEPDFEPFTPQII